MTRRIGLQIHGLPLALDVSARSTALTIAHRGLRYCSPSIVLLLDGPFGISAIVKVIASQESLALRVRHPEADNVSHLDKIRVRQIT